MERILTPIFPSRREGALDPDLPLYDLQTLEELVTSSVSQPRFYMLLLGKATRDTKDLKDPEELFLRP